MTRIERLAYQRGYSRGHRWPEHRPPMPPNDVLAEYMMAMREGRDAIDMFQAALMPDDEWSKQLCPIIDRIDEAHEKLSAWILNYTAHDGREVG